ncbi:glycosyltransferase [Ensifer sp. ENS12]|uniref:glycosyltransferase n=1 Tax=Ensifer sp. ENS12 TaxID=2854774 RepID=UPI001C493FF2|nr:glycosyltransferase [Ensifer sp. ENS12]MBV7522124.1 glycosyltransferase [Ensifer sp. ENS12]
MRKIVVISDFQDGWPPVSQAPTKTERLAAWASRFKDEMAAWPTHENVVHVSGGYLERLPLASVADGLVDRAEIWSHWRASNPPPEVKENSFLTRRSFYLDGSTSPFSSDDMLAHIEIYGAPDILCVWGLGVGEEILQACQTSFKIYNSIDAPALRVPSTTSRHFDLILTGSEEQSRDVEARHPGKRTAILPIGPEFAAPSMFFPIEGAKAYDIIYVAAAQAYKRHDILFHALAKLPRTVRALCVFGYGDQSEQLRHQATELELNVDFVGPPGVSFGEVNRLMNLARMGVVCGVDDGAPAVLTEYMLAGLPVLANAELRCGQQYITPQTGATAKSDKFHIGIAGMLSRLADFSPRAAVLRSWTWPHSIKKLRQLIRAEQSAKKEARGN